MVRIEKNKLVIEIETSDPESLYADLLRDIIVCVQAGLQDKDNEEFSSSAHFLLELYKSMLIGEQEVSKIFSKK